MGCPPNEYAVSLPPSSVPLAGRAPVVPVGGRAEPEVRGRIWKISARPATSDTATVLVLPPDGATGTPSQPRPEGSSSASTGTASSVGSALTSGAQSADMNSSCGPEP